MSEELRRILERGLFFWPQNVRDVELLEWHPHARFEGVRLKHLITAEHTGGRFSCHMVEVAPGKSLGDHSHPEQWEIHEVAYGKGCCILDGDCLRYEAGTCAVIPQSMPHSVEAGEEGLLFLAKFIPALL